MLLEMTAEPPTGVLALASTNGDLSDMIGGQIHHPV